MARTRILFAVMMLIGSIVAFTTACTKEDKKQAGEQGTTYTDTRDGKVYKIVTIGTQTWFAENLNYTTGIENITGAEEWESMFGGSFTIAHDDRAAWCYYDNNKANGDLYGALYTHAGALLACPPGWHLPGEQEWVQLTDYLGGLAGAGGRMKEAGESHWLAPNEAANNVSGFSGLPGGSRTFSPGTFKELGTKAYFWSQEKSDFPHCLELLNDFCIVGEEHWFMSTGMSVRCVKD
ncbi:MAG: FISUMP domain-containing protein [Bacteroidota bacterium]